MSIRRSLMPETLIVIRAFLMAGVQVKERESFVDRHGFDDSHEYYDFLEDYGIVDGEFTTVIEMLLDNRIPFDDPNGSRRFSFYYGFPIALEFLNFCEENGIHTNFVVNRDIKDPVLRKTLIEDTFAKRRERSLVVYEKMATSERKRLVFSTLEASPLLHRFSEVSQVAAKVMENVYSPIERPDPNPFVAAASIAKMSSSDYEEAKYLQKMRHLFRPLFVNQEPSFYQKLSDSYHRYLEDIINLNVDFGNIFPWNQQIKKVRETILEEADGKNDFVVDHNNFSRRLDRLHRGIPDNYRPIECLCILEMKNEIAIRNFELEHFDEEFIKLHLSFTAAASFVDDNIVIFDEGSGDIKVKNDVVANVSPGSRGFYFFQRLSRESGYAVSHEELCDYIKKNRNELAVQNAGSYNSKIKGELPTEARALVESSKTKDLKNGYRLLLRVK